MQNEPQTVTPSNPAAPTPPAEPASNWQFTGGDAVTTSVDPPAVTQASTISWTASEFIAHSKTPGWYLLLALITVASATLAFLITGGDKLTTGVILIAGLLFGIMAARQPRELPYSLDAKGLQIGEKHYPYADFKSFSLVQEEGIEAIWLLPLQRFAPGLSIYFSPQDKDNILNILDNYLPVEQRQLDFVDKLMHKIRF